MRQSLKHIRLAFKNGKFRFSVHATKEAYEERILPSEVMEALEHGEILEDYPDHQRGPCCLIYGQTRVGRDLHIICSSTGFPIVVVTVYEPKEPKWVTPRQRRR